MAPRGAAPPVPLLTAVPGPEEAQLVAALGRTPGVVVVRRCADLGELLSASAAGHGRAALVSADLHRVDRDALARLAAAGTAVVGVVPAASLAPLTAGAASTRLTALGVHRQVAADAEGADVAAAVAAAVADLAARSATGPAAPSAALAAPGPLHGPPPAQPPTTPQPAVPDPREPLDGSLDSALDDAADSAVDRAPGRLIAVWGAPGAPGRTTVATTLAAELAHLAERAGGRSRGLPGERVLLVDADTWAASTAQVLGLLDESAGVAAACRAAAAGTLTPERLAALAPPVLPGLSVLTGLPRAERWHELGVAALEQLWATCRATAAWTVVDCAAPLEQDEELVLDTAAPRRNAATTTALAAADVVLVVGQADPVGLQRLVRALADLAEAEPPSSLRHPQQRRAVVTKVRSAAVGPDPAARVTEALARYAGVRDAVLVPDDRTACDAALLAGRALTEVAPGSPARQALASLAADLHGGPAPARRARRGSSRRRWARMRA